MAGRAVTGGGWKERMAAKPEYSATLELFAWAERLAKRPESAKALAEYEKLRQVYHAAFNACYNKYIGHDPELVRHINRRLGYHEDCKGINAPLPSTWSKQRRASAVPSVMRSESTAEPEKQEEQKKLASEAVWKTHSDPAQPDCCDRVGSLSSAAKWPPDSFGGAGVDMHNTCEAGEEAIVHLISGNQGSAVTGEPRASGPGSGEEPGLAARAPGPGEEPDLASHAPCEEPGPGEEPEPGLAARAPGPGEAADLASCEPGPIEEPGVALHAACPGEEPGLASFVPGPGEEPDLGPGPRRAFEDIGNEDARVNGVYEVETQMGEGETGEGQACHVSSALKEMHDGCNKRERENSRQSSKAASGLEGTLADESGAGDESITKMKMGKLQREEIQCVMPSMKTRSDSATNCDEAAQGATPKEQNDAADPVGGPDTCASPQRCMVGNGQLQREATRPVELRRKRKASAMACDELAGEALDKTQKRANTSLSRDEQRSNANGKAVSLTAEKKPEDLCTTREKGEGDRSLPGGIECELETTRGFTVGGGPKEGRKMKSMGARKAMGCKALSLSNRLAKPVGLRKANDHSRVVYPCPYCHGKGWIGKGRKKVRSVPVPVPAAVPGADPGRGRGSGRGLGDADKACWKEATPPRAKGNNDNGNVGTPRAKRNNENALPFTCDDVAAGVIWKQSGHKGKQEHLPVQTLGLGLADVWQSSVKHRMKKRRIKEPLTAALSASGQLEGNYYNMKKFETSRRDAGNTRGGSSFTQSGKLKCVTAGGTRSELSPEKGLRSGERRNDEGVEQERRRIVRKTGRGLHMGEDNRREGIKSNHFGTHHKVADGIRTEPSPRQGVESGELRNAELVEQEGTRNMRKTDKGVSMVEENREAEHRSNYTGIHRATDTKRGGSESTPRIAGLPEDAKSPGSFQDGGHGGNHNVGRRGEDISGRHLQKSEGERANDELTHSSAEGLVPRKRRRLPSQGDATLDTDCHRSRTLAAGREDLPSLGSQLRTKFDRRAREHLDDGFPSIPRRLSMGGCSPEVRRGCASPQPERTACNAAEREHTAAMEGVKGRPGCHQAWGKGLVAGERQADEEGNCVIARHACEKSPCTEEGHCAIACQPCGKSACVDHLCAARADGLCGGSEYVANEQFVRAETAPATVDRPHSSRVPVSDASAKVQYANAAIHKAGSMGAREEGQADGAGGEGKSDGSGDDGFGFCNRQFSNARQFINPDLQEDLASFSWHDTFRWDIAAPAVGRGALPDYGRGHHTAARTGNAYANNAPMWGWDNGMARRSAYDMRFSRPHGMWYPMPRRTGAHAGDNQGEGEDMGSSVDGRHALGVDAHIPPERNQPGRLYFDRDRVPNNGRAIADDRPRAGADHGGWYMNHWRTAQMSPGLSDTPTGFTEVGSVDPKMEALERRFRRE